MKIVELRTESRQAEKLMECVERAVVADPANFNLFLCVLDQCEQKSIAEYLRLLNRSMILPKPGKVKFYCHQNMPQLSNIL